MINQLRSNFLCKYIWDFMVYFLLREFSFSNIILMVEEEEERKPGLTKWVVKSLCQFVFPLLELKLLCGQQSCKSEILWDGIDDTAKYEHCNWVGRCILQYPCSASMQQVGQLMDCYSFVLKWSSTAMLWNVLLFFLKGCTKMHFGWSKFKLAMFSNGEIFVKWPPFWAFLSSLSPSFNL